MSNHVRMCVNNAWHTPSLCEFYLYCCTQVWVAGNGQRVAAFNVSKYCVLVSITHGILGLNNVTGKGMNIKAFQVALLDPKGHLKTVQVPFHLALR